jgi:hypothetical protein
MRIDYLQSLKPNAMKRILTLVFLCFTFSSFSQTLVNQTPNVLPGSVSLNIFIKGESNGTGGYVVMQNVYSNLTSTNSFELLEIDSTGSPINSYDFTSLHNGSDFGTNLYVKGSSAYACGFTLDTPTVQGNTFNIVKLSLATFDTVWTTSVAIDSAVMQSPTAILADDTGYVYICGGVWTAAGYKQVLVKYDSLGNQQWVSSYFIPGMNTTATGMVLSAGLVNVSGFSYDSSGNSYFVGTVFDRVTGTLLGYKYSPNYAGNLSRLAGIGTDLNRNTYMAGTSQVSPTGSVIKVIAYDSLFLTTKWVATFGDSTKVNQASAVYVANSIAGTSYVLVAGTVVNGSGSTDLALLEYNMDGTLKWSRTISSPNPSFPATGFGVYQEGNSSTNYVTGTVFNGTDNDVVTAAYDTLGNILWQKTYNRGAGINDVPSGIAEDNGSILVTASSLGVDSVYLVLEYDTYTKTDTLAATSGGGQYMNNELIIRFDPSAVDLDAVNNTDINFGTPSYWLTPAADSALQANVSFDLSTCTMERIYKGLKASYKYSIARNGDSVRIPDLWAGFLLMHPYAGKGDETDVAQSINSLFPLVVHTGLNYVGKFMGCNNDKAKAPLTINDPYFAMGGSVGGQLTGQQNLWNDTIHTDCDQNYSIHVDSAWLLETGKPFIKVGIYDSGLDGLNEDFCLTLGGFQSGVKANGWDFYNNVSMPSTSWVNADAQGFAHGTMIAGIIGAIRNNSKGVAGIAGGNWSSVDTTNAGVMLYGMKILRDSTPSPPPGGTASTFYGLITLPIADLCNALTMGCSYVPGSNYGYGLHVINNSWGVEHDSVGYNNLVQGRALDDMDFGELELAFKNVYRNQTAIVAAAGNSQQYTIYPANFYGDWIICVGGANDTGTRYVNPNNGGQTNYLESYAGSCVDIIAPSFSDPVGNAGYVINTTIAHSPNRNSIGFINYEGITNNFQGAYGGTSLAAPHATGTIALLMSYLDSSASAYQNISPEDAEHLLTRSATDVDTPGYDINTGWGDLNAGRTLQDVNQACKLLLHFGRQQSSTYHAGLVSQNVQIRLTEKYTNPVTNVSYDTIPYLCNVYKVEHTNAHNLSSNLSIEDAWARPSSATLLLAWDSVSHTLQPFEHLYLDSLNTQSVEVSGYFYTLLAPDSFTIIGTWGIDSTLLPDSTGYEYTLLLRDNSKNCYTVDTTRTSIRETQNELKVAFYPNPVEDAGILQIYSDANTKATIAMFDEQGRKIETIYEGSLQNGGTTFNINTKALSSGLYMIVVNTSEGRKTIKFTKL